MPKWVDLLGQDDKDMLYRLFGKDWGDMTVIHTVTQLLKYIRRLER